MRDRHEIQVRASPERVFRLLRRSDLGESRVIRWLFRLRGISDDVLSFDALLRFGFVLLGERPNREIALGLIGRFWTFSAHIQRVDAEAFRRFDEQGFAKAVASISLSQHAEGITCVAIETRVRCLGNASRRRFRLYWLFVGPFSGMIRRAWLHSIKRQAEATRR